MAIADVFLTCDRAVLNGVALRSDPGREGSPFQNWFEDALRHEGIGSHGLGANAWPDFQLDDDDEGYELKGLQVPGRWQDFDANSRLPKGRDGANEIYYVFGRYPKDAVRDRRSLTDLVIVHGSFLSRDGQLIHKNTSVRGAGSYGDVLIRVRKMFVPRTPFRSVDGTIGRRTLIVPEEISAVLDGDERLRRVGRLVRREADHNIRRITIDLSTAGLDIELEASPTGGREHVFAAYRSAASDDYAVAMADVDEAMGGVAGEEADDDA